MIIQGDSIEVLKSLDEGSVDALVTDPPYGLNNITEKKTRACLSAWVNGEKFDAGGAGFMGKDWDKWTPPPELWREVYRVMKAGAHGLVFAGSRTQDLMTLSLRLAGFEVIDVLMWLYSPRFPKALDVSKAIDKELGVERRVIGKQKLTGTARRKASGGSHGCAQAGESVERVETWVDVTAATSEQAIKFDDWHTALKPAYEPVILIRKPLDGTVVNNVMTHGTGALNIGACRVGDDYKYNGREGRHPCNVLIDDGVAEGMGTRARFYFTDKSSVAEREAGVTGEKKRNNTHPTVKPIDLMRYLCRLITPPQGVVLDPFTGSGSTGCAAALEGFEFIGIEREQEYVEIAEQRVKHWSPLEIFMKGKA